ncbi:MAG: hypothetical protein M3R51_05090 [Candidatus Eremiobacteraeota bacterium]|nr:hypothetical protein [Candidatus Eremiobacteraeota bacterium]
MHDNVTLTGGVQMLRAPTLPPVPTITPAAWETNGSYRIATLDATTEMPCYIAWQYQRAVHGLAGSAVDEWLTENVRSANAYEQSTQFVPAPWPENSEGSIVTATMGTQNIAGGSSCSSFIPNAFSGPTRVSNSADSRTLWFGGQYVTYQSGNQATGLSEFPIDPRSFTDPNVLWP